MKGLFVLTPLLFITKTFFMFKSICILLVSFSVVRPAGLHAQNVLSGKITDVVGGSPLVGASVYIADLKLGAVSGRDGMYLIRNLPAGVYVVSVSMIGYARQVEGVTVKGTISRNYSFKPVFDRPERCDCYRRSGCNRSTKYSFCHRFDEQ